MFFSSSSSQSSISRFYKRTNEETINQFWKIEMAQACSFVDFQIQPIVLDADSTVVKTYGHQEEAGYISHYKTKGVSSLIILFSFGFSLFLFNYFPQLESLKEEWKS